jgi:spore germination cell wall hydrolase CwlJ-like protein
MKGLVWAAALVSSSIQATELKDLAEAVYFEARSEPIGCQVAVAQSILNRVYQERFPDTVGEVVHQKKWSTRAQKTVCQYSYYCDGKPDVMKDASAEVTAYQVASFVLERNIFEMHRGADHYYAHNTVTPGWASQLTNSFVCGEHTIGQLKW